MATAADEPTGYVCTFKIGQTHSWEKRRFKREAASPVTLDLAEIAPAQQTAVLVSGDRRTPVRVIRAVSALHVLEVVGEGFLNVTTIYDREAGTTTYPAVHARHFGVLGQPIVSNYRGACRAK
jgi:hypothetical protein